MSNLVYTQSHTFLFFPASSSIPLAVSANPILFNCLTRSFIMVLWARQTTMILEMVLAFPFIRYITHEKSWKILNSFKNRWEGLQRHLPLTIFLRNPSFLQEGTPLRDNLNTMSLIEKSLTGAISHVLSASVMLKCWQNLSKLANQRVYHILVYPEWRFVKFPTGILLLPLATLFWFFHMLFSALLPS